MSVCSPGKDSPSQSLLWLAATSTLTEPDCSSDSKFHWCVHFVHLVIVTDHRPKTGFSTRPSRLPVQPRNDSVGQPPYVCLCKHFCAQAQRICEREGPPHLHNRKVQGCSDSVAWSSKGQAAHQSCTGWYFGTAQQEWVSCWTGMMILRSHTRPLKGGLRKLANQCRLAIV